MQPAEKIDTLRKLMKDNRLDAWIIPSSDPHQSEYVAAHWQARTWASGFHGSAGTLVVTQACARLWTDPRYHIRAAQELSGSGIDLVKMGLAGAPSIQDWLLSELPSGARIGFDGRMMALAEARVFIDLLKDKSIEVSFMHDLVGEIWLDRPPLPSGAIFLLEERFSGETRGSKIERIRAQMQAQGVNYHLLCALDEIAWTLNMRGGDIDYNPVAICFAVITLTEVCLFIEPEKVPPDVKALLEQDGVSFHAYSDIECYLSELPENCQILIDPEKTNVKLFGTISDQRQVKEGHSLPYWMKTVKNPQELEGIRQMHRRDGAALVRWLCWLDQNVAGGQYSEITAAQKLMEFRGQDANFISPSFSTICGYGANSAVGHYQSDPRNAPELHPHGILLIDSGGQYLDGTSDITRTLSLGNASPAERQAFTTVLRCHIHLAMARFPRGTNGSHLDALARAPLWRKGWNCRHGIGHGVGCFLNVHEGPIRFNQVNQTILEPGMVISNEPGVYFEGRFGIRIENILIVLADATTEFGEFLRFETVSLSPIDLDLVDPAMLEPEEIDWLNAYHQQVWDSLSPLLNQAEQTWLQRETRKI